MENVLVTDGNQRAALAVTRSLGGHGLRVITADSCSPTLSSRSKYAAASEVYSDPNELDAFIASVRRIVDQHGIRTIIPISEITLFTLLQHREALGGVEIPFDSYEKISLLSDKARLVELCQKNNIPCPKSVYYESGEAALAASRDFEFPVVLKPYKSRIFSDGAWVSTSVKYAASAEQLRQLCTTNPVFAGFPFMIQEYIEGRGQGVFLLCDHGKPVATFCHKRLREKPPSGGVSVLCESVDPPEEMLAIACELLSSVAWHGVAMVEFKVNDERGPFIMEVNTRFWGSLQLAVDAGVDFPYLLWRMYSGKPTTLIRNYKKGQRLRWLIGDLDRLYLVIRSPDFSVSQKLRELLSFLAMFRRRQRFEVNRLQDIRPFGEELRQYWASLIRGR